MEEVVRNKEFLRKEVYPNIVSNPFASNLAEQTKKVPLEILDRSFTSTDEVTWMPSFEGMYPVIQNPLFPDMKTQVPAKDSQPFIIPYGDLPALIVKPGYNQR